MVWYRDKRIKTEYGMSIMDKTHPARARRLKPSGTLTNDHTDNEVQPKRHHPPLRKNTAHKADANLLKHTTKRMRGVKYAVLRTPAT